ncbi:MAG: HD domain-containing protein [Clostridiales bacterium]|jgi:HD-GYP domain-containing protein (c-di-GMP phosphodiesterase class II)|nr:HD domain-containing protein [Clostridiales bacterium]
MGTINGGAVVNIFLNTLGLFDGRLRTHGEHVGYILYKMLEFDDTYSFDERRIFLVLGALHDFAAYKTDKIDDLLSYDLKDVWPHSVYGYFYMQYLSPFADYARIFLLHHLNHAKLDALKPPHQDVIEMVRLADSIDLMIYHGQYSEVNMVRQLGPHIAGSYVKLFLTANAHYHIIENIMDDTYRQELDILTESIDWEQGVADQLLKTLVYTIDFKNESTVLRTLNANAMCEYLADKMKLTPDEKSDLQYASLVYDLGMLGVPDSVLNAPRRLTPSERELVEGHVNAVEKILKPHVSDGILQIAIRHHERLDGLGYPRGLKEKDLSLPQRILAAADVMAALQTDKEYKPALGKQDVIRALLREVKEHKLGMDIVRVIERNYDELMNTVKQQGADLYGNYLTVKQSFPSVLQQFQQI